MNRSSLRALPLLLVAALAFQARSQVPSVDEVVRNLGGDKPAAASDLGASRGWTVQGADPARKAGARPQGRIATHAYSETRIQFEFDSDRLTPQTLQVLDVFAEAIKTPNLASAVFTIEGHTDGVGNDAYNLDLSRRRAEAVVKYLVESRGIDAKRLVPVGKGKSELAVNDPSSPLNRRVVWITTR